MLTIGKIGKGSTHEVSTRALNDVVVSLNAVIQPALRVRTPIICVDSDT